jgi:dolichyl-phosphate beta-glucosyltransferase
MIARDLGYQIAEVPIRWRHQEGSKVVLLRDGPRMLRDLVRLRLTGKRKRLERRAD